MKLHVDMPISIKTIVYIVITCFTYSCATTPMTVHKGTNIIITETGLEAIGIGVSQNEKMSNSIAVRSARMNLMDYLNSALANTYKELEIHDIAEHKENILQNSKVIVSNSFVRRKNITTQATVVITLDGISKWVEFYYDNLSADDILRLKTTKNEFMGLMYKHLHINFNTLSL